MESQPNLRPRAEAYNCETITDDLVTELLLDIQNPGPHQKMLETYYVDRTVADMVNMEVDDETKRELVIAGEIVKWQITAQSGDQLPYGMGYRNSIYGPKLTPEFDSAILPLGYHMSSSIISQLEATFDYDIGRLRSGAIAREAANPESLLHSLLISHPVVAFLRSFNTPETRVDRPLTEFEKLTREQQIIAEAWGPYESVPAEQRSSGIIQQGINSRLYQLDDIRVPNSNLGSGVGAARPTAKNLSGTQKLFKYIVEGSTELSPAESLPLNVLPDGRVDLNGEITDTVYWRGLNVFTEALADKYPIQSCILADAVGTLVHQLCHKIVATLGTSELTLDEMILEEIRVLTSLNSGFSIETRLQSPIDDAILFRSPGVRLDPTIIQNDDHLDSVERSPYLGGWTPSYEALANSPLLYNVQIMNPRITNAMLIGRLIMKKKSHVSPNLLPPDTTDVVVSLAQRESSSKLFTIPGFQAVQYQNYLDTSLLQRDNEYDPYGQCDVPLQNMSELVKWYKNIGAAQLVDAIKSQQPHTVDDLVNLIKVNSDYAVYDEKSIRALINYSSSKTSKASLEESGSALKDGRLQLQCVEAATLLRNSLSLIFKTNNIAYITGNTIGVNAYNELGTNSIPHMQLVFFYNERRYILDATPYMSAEDSQKFNNQMNNFGRFATYNAFNTHVSEQNRQISQTLPQPSMPFKPFDIEQIKKDILETKEAINEEVYVPEKISGERKVYSILEVQAQLEAQLFDFFGVKNRKALYNRLPTPRKATTKPLPQPDPVHRTLAAIKDPSNDFDEARDYVQKYPHIQTALKRRGVHLREYQPHVLAALTRALDEATRSQD